MRERFSLSWRQARQRILKGQIWIDGAPVLDLAYRLAEGISFEHVAHARAPVPQGPRLPPEAIRTQDRDIVVVEKPADLLTVPYQKGDRDTLDQLLADFLSRGRHGKSGRRAPPYPVHVVHRLDRGTSGLLVFARTLLARNQLKDQFRNHSAHRRYVALVQGHLTSITVTSHLLRDRGDGLRGSLEQAPERLKRKLGRGKLAITHIEALERLVDATLISCRLETGRTNQIRIHLAELGHPLIGETVYRRGLAPTITATPRLCLHAAELGFAHPRTDEALMFHSEIPAAIQEEIDARR